MNTKESKIVGKLGSNIHLLGSSLEYRVYFTKDKIFLQEVSDLFSSFEKFIGWLLPIFAFAVYSMREKMNWGIFVIFIILLISAVSPVFIIEHRSKSKFKAAIENNDREIPFPHIKISYQDFSQVNFEKSEKINLENKNHTLIFSYPSDVKNFRAFIRKALNTNDFGKSWDDYTEDS